MPEKEFKMMIVRMLTELERRVEKLSKTFSQEKENIQKTSVEEYNNLNKKHTRGNQQ